MFGRDTTHRRRKSIYYFLLIGVFKMMNYHCYMPLYLEVCRGSLISNVSGVGYVSVPEISGLLSSDIFDDHFY